MQSAEIIMDKLSGRSKGFGFVQMASQEELDKAIKMFNGHLMGNRELRVNVARPKTEGRNTGGDQPRRYGSGFGRSGGGDNRDRHGGSRQY